MNCIKIIGTGSYVPLNIKYNEEIEKDNNLSSGYIYKMTGIEKRHYVTDENIEDLAIKAIENMLDKYNITDFNADMIVVASTSLGNIMPSISFKIQSYFKIEKCICMDIAAGCSAYINAFDIVQKYIATGYINNAIVVGVDTLSKNKYEDITDEMLFGDGAGVVFLAKDEREKIYYSMIESIYENNQILTCDINHNLHMDGKEVYKFATSKTIDNLNKLLKLANVNKNEIKYGIPHQSNLRILEKISKKSDICMYTNIRDIANTFCASIPIALDELYYNKQIKSGDKIILLGYGGGLNLGSILMEV